MPISMNPMCLQCSFQKNMSIARPLGDDAKAMAFARGLMQIYLDAPEGAPSPYVNPQIADLLNRLYGLPIDRFHQEKIDSNQFFLDRQEQIRSRMEQAPDPIYTGLTFSILGNYLDFSALQGNVSFDKLEEMLDQAQEMELDRTCYDQFLRDLEKGGKLLYLTDNAGEIGFDKLFAQAIRKQYPQTEITFCVRGAICQNDATREDTRIIGLDFPVIDNGNRVPGTVLELLGPEARKALEEADIVLAKGMANVETMYGLPYNIYYAFLVKCEHFVEIFHQPLFTPMFVREPLQK